jgi:SAM-dependent methyltransferase
VWYIFLHFFEREVNLSPHRTLSLKVLGIAQSEQEDTYLCVFVVVPPLLLSSLSRGQEVFTIMPSWLVLVSALLVIFLSCWQHQYQIEWREILTQVLHHDNLCVVAIPLSDLKLPLSEEVSSRRFNRKLNKLAEEEDWYGRDWLRLLVDTGIYFEDECPNTLDNPDDFLQLETCMLKARRKEWEFIQGIEAMKALGKFNNASTALGIGSGHESVVFYLARHLGHVTASDLYNGGGWNTREGDPSMLGAPELFSPFGYPEERLTVVHMDGLDILYPDAHFDIVFSFSSIEHFYTITPYGFLKAATRSIQEMARVVRPSGVVTIATEVIVNGIGHYDWIAGILPMRNFFFPEEILEYIVKPAASAGLRLVEPIDWSLSEETLRHSVPLGRCRQDFPHVLLRDRGVVWTSISIAFQKDKDDV